jgi:thioredoxin 1
MATVELTKDTFEEVVTGNEIVLIDFWASWCGPCQRFAPTYTAVAEANPDVVFAKVDTEAEPELAGSFRIQSIPTLMVVRDQVVLYSQPGAIGREALEDLVEQARKIDMDEVRRQVAAETAASSA